MVQYSLTYLEMLKQASLLIFFIATEFIFNKSIKIELKNGKEIN